MFDHVMYTKPFAEISRSDVPLVGGKGAFLGELVHHGVAVPDGFVVLTDAFRRVLDTGGLAEQIQQAFDGLRQGQGSLQDVSSELSSRLLNTVMPEDLAAEITVRHAALGAPLVAVRSSATAEDHADHSWAGQLESYLNVTAETLLPSVRQCWASVFSPRAITYGLGQTRDPHRNRVAVVVQAMVDPEVSGVAFSVDPVSEDPDVMIIEAVFGLGESIVQGQLTPDHYQVRKAPLAVTEVFQSLQDRGIYRLADGSTGWRDLDAGRAARQKLAPDDITTLAGMVIAIERLAGFPCDIEWAYAEGQFFILQCRPITTLG